MAEHVEEAAAEATYDLGSLLGTEERDFLIRSNGDQVKISSLGGKVVGILFTSSMAPELCEWFIPILIQTYEELSMRKAEFEIVLSPNEMGEEEFKYYFSEIPMPWLALPYSESNPFECFGNLRIPSLVVLDPEGKVVTKEGVDLVSKYRGDAYPFTDERIQEVEKEMEVMRQNPTLHNMLLSSPTDFMIGSDGSKVPVSELEGKIVAVYFAFCSDGATDEFTQRLVDMYRKLKETGENFEVVTVSLDNNLQEFEKGFADLPWFALPYQYSISFKLIVNFSDAKLVVIGSDGMLQRSDVAKLFLYYGIGAYPFSPEKLAELREKDKAKNKGQTLESLLVSGELNYLIRNDNSEVPVAELVGKNILLYFAAKDGAFCQILRVLIKAYHTIKERIGDAFEVVFVSQDGDESAFDDMFDKMPWLALPFGDPRIKSLWLALGKLSEGDIVAIGPNGRTVTREARMLVANYGAAAFPFTKQRTMTDMEEVAEAWPEKIHFYYYENYKNYKLVKYHCGIYIYNCAKCQIDGMDWCYSNDDGTVTLHPRCALPYDDEMNGFGVRKKAAAEETIAEVDPASSGLR